MAIPTKAMISYTVGEGAEAATSTLQFHSIEEEAHKSESETTKYPAQVGYEVSRNTIKKNRKVSITAMITNTILAGSENAYEYGTNNVKTVMSALESLVNDAIPCDVITNKTSYERVIFTKFQTKTVAGETDFMKFTISGEEIRKVKPTNATTPTLLVFTPLSDEERKARIDELEKAQIFVNDTAVLTQATVDISKSFQIETVNKAGDPYTVTYEATDYDPVTGETQHQVHTDDTSILDKVSGAVSDATYAAGSMLPDLGLEAGGTFSGGCTAPKQLLTYVSDNYLATPLGDLKRSVYGAAYELVGVNGDQNAGQFLVGLAAECAVLSQVGEPVSINEAFEAGTPSVDDFLDGASSVGENAEAGVEAPESLTTVTKITNPAVAEESSYFGDLFA